MLDIPLEEGCGKIIFESLDVGLYSRSVWIFTRGIDRISMTQSNKSVEILITLCQTVCRFFITVSPSKEL